MEAEIKAALEALFAGIERGEKTVVAEQMARLDDLAARGRAGLHPQLLHFLERRSYAKARLWLGGAGDIPAGVCGGGRGGPGRSA
jgi:hypothetical protein